MTRVHATCVAIDGRGVLITGASGSGKSDLALRLIDRGAMLVSDDYTVLHAEHGRLVASAPTNIAGQLEVRGIGIVPIAVAASAAVALVARSGEPERMPAPATCDMAGMTMPLITLALLEPSAPLKVELALRRISS